MMKDVVEFEVDDDCGVEAVIKVVREQYVRQGWVNSCSGGCMK